MSKRPINIEASRSASVEVILRSDNDVNAGLILLNLFHEAFTSCKAQLDQCDPSPDHGEPTVTVMFQATGVPKP